MKLDLRARSAATAGFTLVEMMVALGVFGLLGYSLTITADVGSDSQRTVMSVVAEDRALRSTLTSAVEELRASRDDTISVTTLADGNHQLRFMQPIEVGGSAVWGVHEFALGPDAVSQDRAGWSLQYTVHARPQSDGSVVRELVREILDDALVVQRSRVIVSRLRGGGGDPPGFHVVHQGEVWVLTLSTEGRAEGTTGMKAVFHVQTRN